MDKRLVVTASNCSIEGLRAQSRSNSYQMSDMCYQVML